MGKKEEIYYDKQKKKLLEVPWKVVPCFDERKNGVECWCAVIEPKKKMWMDMEKKHECYIIGYGEISKEVAKHIVTAHNEYIKLKK